MLTIILHGFLFYWSIFYLVWSSWYDSSPLEIFFDNLKILHFFYKENRFLSPCTLLQMADLHSVNGWIIVHLHVYTTTSLSIHEHLGCLHSLAAAKSLQSCPTLCDPIDGSPPGSPFPGTLQARTLEWVAISFSSAWKWKVKVKSLSRRLSSPSFSPLNKQI